MRLRPETLLGIAVAVMIVVALLVATALTGCTGQSLTGLPEARATALPEPLDFAPEAAKTFRRAITREVRLVWGLDGSAPAQAAQMEQESGWRADARSPYAIGLAQFTPSTADWIDDAYPDLGPADPWNPDWSIRASSRYMKHLFDRTSGATEADRYWFAALGYNGGAKWVERDKNAAALAGRDAERYREVAPFNAGRNQVAFAENRGYVPAICKRQPKYSAWGRMIDCGVI